MKKKILIISAVFSVLFLLSGIYIIASIEKATSTLDNLVKLHQVEILREHLLLQIKRVQTDLSLNNTPHARGIDAIIADVRNMQRVASACAMCHHATEVANRLNDMRNQVDRYSEALSRVLTIRANDRRRHEEEDAAFNIGEELVTKVSGMIAFTSVKLEEKTTANLGRIKNTKLMLYGLVGIGPFVVTGFALFLIGSLANPIKTLLEATRRIREGALDHKVAGLKHEFGEVAESFNDMAVALQENMQRIEESEKRYRTLFESAADAIFILEAEGPDAGKIVAANKASGEMHGYPVSELVTLNIRDLCAPDSVREVEGRIGRILAGEWVKTETDHRRKDGAVFPVEISAGLLDLADHKKYILVFDRDISERKQAEKVLQRTEQLKMCGEIAAGLAHEIKNPLAGIKASMELLFKDLNVGEPDKTILLKAIEDTIRIESFMKGLLGFARPAEPQFTVLDINAVLDSTVAFSLRHPSLSGKGKVVTVQKDLSEDIPKTLADPLKLQQVFLNLLLNAADAIPQSGIIIAKTIYNAPSQTIEVTISDNGKGFDEQMLKKIFEPFYTTKPKGTGLGLAISKRLVEQHGGNIRVESSPGKGTTFVISLPVRDEEKEKAA